MELLSRSTNRRVFLATALPSLSALSIPARADSELPPICVFNKPLQHLDYASQAELVAEMGFSGIEGTVRKGGHVEPERVEQDLPGQIEALSKNGIEMTIMTTDVNEVESPVHSKVLRTAAELGVKRFRMGSIRLAYDRPLDQQLLEIEQKFSALVQFCSELGIQPLYQNHSGAGRFGAAIWDLHRILRQYSDDPKQAGVAFDIRHAVVEGGLSWPTEFHLIKPWIGAVYCKDFLWDKEKRRPYNVPLGTGMVDFPAFFKRLKASDFRGPISLHMEYKNHRDSALLQESIAAIREDRARLVELLQAEWSKQAG